MIKIYNQKSIKEINELREKGLYNAPFSVLEAMDKVELTAPTEEIEKEVMELKAQSAMSQVSTYQLIAQAKKELQDEQAKSLIGIYQIIGGLK